MDDVFVVQDVVLADLLGLVLHRRAPDESVLHLLDDRAMDLVTEVLDLKLVENPVKEVQINLTTV